LKISGENFAEKWKFAGEKNTIQVCTLAAPSAQAASPPSVLCRIGIPLSILVILLFALSALPAKTAAKSASYNQL
jgi:hypothetical protein